MTDLTRLADVLSAAFADAIKPTVERIAAEAAAAQRPLSAKTMLSPADAAAHMGRLGIKAGAFWLRERGLVSTIPAAEFGAHRAVHDVELVVWGDVIDAVAAYRHSESKKVARGAAATGLKSGGLRR